MNYHTPEETAVLAVNAGSKKASLPVYKMILLGILAGVYIGFGANIAIKIGSAPDSNSALGIFLYGAVFSIGLMLVMICGAELFTGNNMTCFMAVLDGKATVGGLFRNWVVVYLSNFIGSVLLAYIVFLAMFWVTHDPSGTVILSPVGEKAVYIAKNKMGLSFSAAFMRGILCNWMVCLAVFMALAAKDIVGKIFGIFFPIMAFVSSGYEHCVANMFYVPYGIIVAKAAPHATASSLGISAAEINNIFTYGHFITSNLIPVTLGNIVGGAIFVGTFYYFVYIKQHSSKI
ncbi:formate/nitrite transporter family protein [Thermosyntropha sp.]|uniref:formate/nitrite transporter family protein n=1 Tax=Thermosyntropha sp. TaxID=2740820 RepID=UPI0025F4A19B|nr:formate/nitrite transporter family protein [Thermosyntropha sp.]MBO8159034.1 formate/nitrite transporter family protein [Thermosyntropha sp.]